MVISLLLNSGLKYIFVENFAYYMFFFPPVIRAQSLILTDVIMQKDVYYVSAVQS